MTHPVDIRINLPTSTGGLPGITRLLPSAATVLSLLKTQVQFEEFDYVSAVMTELLRKAEHPHWSGRVIRNIHFVSETYGRVAPQSIERIFKTVRSGFCCTRDTRVTFDFVPELMDTSYLREVEAVGVNRLIVKSWSFVPSTLRGLGRDIETANRVSSKALDAIVTSRDLGIKEVGVDLAVAVPGQTQEDFRRELDLINEYQPDDVAVYPVADPAGRKLTELLKMRQATAAESIGAQVSGSMRSRMLRVLGNTLEFGGYQSSQLHEFVKPGKAGRFSVFDRLWRDVLGVGAGAATRITDRSNRRLEVLNSQNLNRYMDLSLLADKTPSTVREVPPEEFIFEYISAHLSRSSGFDCQEVESCFRVGVEDLYPGLIHILTTTGFLRQNGSRVELTGQGNQVANNVIAGFKLSPSAVRHACKKRRIEVRDILHPKVSGFLPALAA